MRSDTRMTNRSQFLLCSALLLGGAAQAQLGGSTVFRILDIPSSARIAALGGSPVAVLDNDLNLGLFNPALLKPFFVALTFRCHVSFHLKVL